MQENNILEVYADCEKHWGKHMEEIIATARSCRNSEAMHYLLHKIFLGHNILEEGGFMKKLVFIFILSITAVMTSVHAEAQTYDKENGRLYSGISKSLMELEEAEAYRTYTAYTTANVNVREDPSKKSEIVDVLPFNTELQVYSYNDKWCCIEGCQLFVKKDYLSEKGNVYCDFDIPRNSGFKSFMSYRSITCRTSDQFLLQDKYAYTGKYGIRQVDGRYCVAVGTAFDAGIGTYIDLILENGTVIPCIVADIKASCHTLADNITTAASGCVSEFVVDTGKLSFKVKQYGDVSKCCKEWDSPVEMIRVYEKNIL